MSAIPGLRLSKIRNWNESVAFSFLKSLGSVHLDNSPAPTYLLPGPQVTVWHGDPIGLPKGLCSVLLGSLGTWQQVLQNYREG